MQMFIVQSSIETPIYIASARMIVKYTGKADSCVSNLELLKLHLLHSLKGCSKFGNFLASFVGTI